MSKEDQVQKLIRLKRHEIPREGYFDDFLEEFRERCELEKPRSKKGWSLPTIWSAMQEAGPTAKVLGAGLAYAALVLLVVWWPTGPEAGEDENRQPVIYQPEPGGKPAPDSVKQPGRRLKD